MDSLINILYAIRDLISSIAYLIHLLERLWLTLQQLIPRQKPQYSHFHTPVAKSKPRQKWSHSYRTDPKNRELQADLLALLNSDAAVAKRLLRQQRQTNPGRSDNWYLEKVIYDLERDRRS